MASVTYKEFCGGIFETNCYLFEAPQNLTGKFLRDRKEIPW